MKRHIKYWVHKSIYFFNAFFIPTSIEYTTRKNATQKFPIKEKPLVSIITPTYNRSHELPNAINSILKQSYSNYEIIIIDDGSTDDTKKVIYEKFKHLIQVEKIKFISTPNQGASKARNTGIKQANGNIIAYLDSDNTWHKNYLNQMVYHLIKSEADCQYCAIKINNKLENNFSILYTSPFNWNSLLKLNFIDLNSFIHKKKLSDNYGLFDTTLERLEDWDLFLRYTYNSEVNSIKSCLVNYNLEPNKNHLTVIKSHEVNEKKIRDKWPTLPL